MEVKINTTAIADVVSNPRLGLIAANLRDEPDRLAMLSLTMKLHTAWNEDPDRVVAFFLRDNPQLMSATEELLALDHLTGWHEGMWNQAVETDSLSKLVILHLAGVKPPRQPAAGLIEAIEAGKYEVAAYYIAYWGHVAPTGISDFWTDLCADLWKKGEGAPTATAQLICGMMKRSASVIWKRDFDRLAKKYPAQGRPIKAVRSYLEAQADHFDPLPAALQMYAGTAAWGTKVHENLSGIDKLAFAATTCWQGIDHFKNLPDDPQQREQTIEKVTNYMREVSAGLDRDELAEKMVEIGGPLRLVDIMQLFDSTEIGEYKAKVHTPLSDVANQLAVPMASLALMLARTLDPNDPKSADQLEQAFRSARDVSQDISRRELVDAVSQDLPDNFTTEMVLYLFTKTGIGKAD